MLTHLPDYVYRVSLRKYRPLKLPLSCEVVEKGGLAPYLKGMGYTRFRTCIFKSHSLPTSKHVDGFG